MARPHRLHVDAYSAGYRHFLTICTYRRRCYFEDSGVVELVATQFLRTAAMESVSILAYCFMPDHLHAVTESASERSHFARFVRLAKQRAGFQFSRLRRQPLWQESFFDRALRRDEELTEVLRYVIANPVRAGLVESPERYPFWGSGAWSREALLEFIQHHRSSEAGPSGPA